MEGTGVHSEILSPSEIEKVVEIAVRHGVNRIKFTGGEPTLRRDIIEIIRRTRRHIKGDISMTTNGIMLPRLAASLKQAGLDRINISMHSIDRNDFRFITGVDALDKVIDGIRAAKEAGFAPIKLNFVVLKGINVDQIPGMISLCSREGVILQLIEFETTRENENSEEYLRYHVSLDAIEEEVRLRATKVEYNSLHLRPRYNIDVDDKKAVIEFVKPMRNSEFCKHCTRMRLTSTGYLKPCLMRDDNYTDIISGIRNNLEESKLDDILRDAVMKREPYWKEEDELKNTSKVLWVNQG